MDVLLKAFQTAWTASKTYGESPRSRTKKSGRFTRLSAAPKNQYREWKWCSGKWEGLYLSTSMAQLLLAHAVWVASHLSEGYWHSRCVHLDRREGFQRALQKPRLTRFNRYVFWLSFSFLNRLRSYVCVRVCVFVFPNGDPALMVFAVTEISF